MSFVREQGYTREQAYQAVGAGWRPLLERLFDMIGPGGWYESLQVLVVQVKEKFGTLRFYVHIGNNEDEALVKGFHDEINSAEADSSSRCEECGGLGTLDRSHGWLKTLCPTHIADRNQRRDAAWGHERA